MPDQRSLYEKVILDHNKSPRNFHAMENPDHKAEGYNALCGDQFTVYLKMDDQDCIEDITFEGAGCAISKSSASVMTTLLKGKSTAEATKLFTDFTEMITSRHDAPLDEQALGKLMVFSGVREYPVRVKCATLAWHTLISALEDRGDSVSTE
ncbi:MAG: SUF system NifU family Fe-S cluster assembly protein [Candidatus Hydrogenedentota bacterium]